MGADGHTYIVARADGAAQTLGGARAGAMLVRMAILNIQGVLQTGAVPSDGSDPLVPTVQPVRWPTGQDGALALALVDPAGAPVNLTGATLALAVKQHSTDSPILVVVGAVTDAPNGLASFPIANAQTASLAVDIYSYDVWVKLSNARSQVVPASLFSLQAAELPPGGGP